MNKFNEGSRVCVKFGRKGERKECGRVKRIAIQQIPKEVFVVEFDDGGNGSFYEDELIKPKRKR